MISTKKRKPVFLPSVSQFLALLLTGPVLSSEPAEPEEKTPASVLDRFTPEQRKKLLAGEAVFEAELEGTYLVPTHGSRLSLPASSVPMEGAICLLQRCL